MITLKFVVLILVQCWLLLVSGNAWPRAVLPNLLTQRSRTKLQRLRKNLHGVKVQAPAEAARPRFHQAQKPSYYGSMYTVMEDSALLRAGITAWRLGNRKIL